MRRGLMDQIIILESNVVGLVSEDGAARWEFDSFEDAAELYVLLIESVELEERIAKLCNKSK